MPKFPASAFNETFWTIIDGDFYVSTIGNDITGDGSPKLPFLTIHKAFELAQQGEKIVIGPDEYLRVDGVGSNDSAGTELPCRLATNANISIALSGLITIDDVPTIAGDRILIWQQNDPRTNGIYVASANTWERAADFNNPDNIIPGKLIPVLEGTNHAQTIFQFTTNDTIVVGTTNLYFTQAAASDWGQIQGDIVNQADLSVVLDTKADLSILNTHISDESNPHKVDQTQVGLANVNDTSDLNKPVSNPQLAALALKVNNADVIDTLLSTDSSKVLSANQGKILKGFIDNINMLLNSTEVDLDTLQEIVDFINVNRDTLDALSISNIAGLENALLTKADNSTVNTHIIDESNPHKVDQTQVGLANVNDTSDLNKPVSNPQLAALALKVNNADVIDTLLSTDSSKVLSANQGKILKGFIDNINMLLNSTEVDLDTLQEIVDFINVNRDTLDALSISNIAGLENALLTKADKTNVLEKDNTTTFTPATDFHPSTKKYVDDKFSAAGDVTKDGVLVDDQIGVWTGDGSIEGGDQFTYDKINNQLNVARNSVLPVGIRDSIFQGDDHNISIGGNSGWSVVTGEKVEISAGGVFNNSFLTGYDNKIITTSNVFMVNIIGEGNVVSGAFNLGTTWHNIIGNENIIGDEASPFPARNSTIIGNYGEVLNSGCIVLARGLQDTSLVPKILASGIQSLNSGINTIAQTQGHGALANQSSIFGGIDANIPVDSLRSIIVGGNAIKADAATPDTVFLPKVRIGRGTGGTIATGSNENLLVLDETSGEVKQIPQTTPINVIDNLISNNVSEPLSANQGKVLKDLVDGLVTLSRTVPTFADLPTDGVDQENIFVQDASADSTVDAGWAIYKSIGAQPGGTYVKVSEQESLDLVQFINGNGTTVNGNSVDLGGAMTNNFTTVTNNLVGAINSYDMIVKNPANSDIESIFRMTATNKNLGALYLSVGNVSNANVVSLTHNFIGISHTDKVSNNNILLSMDSNGLRITDSLNSKGAEYSSDYSANFIDRSLVDKAYVVSLFNGVTLGSSGSATNFLNEQGNYVTIPLVLYGLNKNIPVTNVTSNGFEYFAGFAYDGRRLQALGDGTDSTAIGLNTISNGTRSIAIGGSAESPSSYMISIGHEAGRTSGTAGVSNISMGRDSNSGTLDVGADSLAFGRLTETSGPGSIAMGLNSRTAGFSSFLMGYHATTQINDTNNSFMLAWDGITAVHLKKEVVATTGDESLFDFNGVVNKSTSGNYTGIKLDITETNTPGALNKLIDLQADSVSQFSVENNGNISASAGVNSTHILGRARLDSRIADNVYLSHQSHTGGSSFAVRQTLAGETTLNSVAGQALRLNIGNTTTWLVDSDGDLNGQGGNNFVVQGTATATSFNGVALTDAGSATNFLNEQGDYVAAGGGGTLTDLKGDVWTQTTSEEVFSFIFDSNNAVSNDSGIVVMKMSDNNTIPNASTNQFSTTDGGGLAFSPVASQIWHRASANARGQVFVSEDGIELTNISGGAIFSTTMSGTRWTFSADYSANYNDRSIVDKGWIDGQISTIDHDSLTGYVANQHIDWTNATSNLVTTGTLIAERANSVGGSFTSTRTTNNVAMTAISAVAKTSLATIVSGLEVNQAYVWEDSNGATVAGYTGFAWGGSDNIGDFYVDVNNSGIITRAVLYDTSATNWNFQANDLTTTGTIDATDFNGVSLTTAGSATNFLNEQGNYVAVVGGNTGDFNFSAASMSITNKGGFFLTGSGTSNTNGNSNDGEMFLGSNTAGQGGRISLASTIDTGTATVGIIDILKTNGATFANRQLLSFRHNNSEFTKVTTSGNWDFINNDLTTTGTYNGVSLTTSGSATNFLNEQGNYVAVGAGGESDVTAASNIGDNLLVKGDGSAKGIQKTGITVGDTNTLSGITDITMTGLITLTTTATNANACYIRGSSLTTGDLGYFRNNSPSHTGKVLNAHQAHVSAASTALYIRQDGIGNLVEFIKNNTIQTVMDNNGDWNFQSNNLITTGNITGNTFNSVPLTTTGSATNFLNEQGNYVAASGGVSASATPLDNQVGVWVNGTLLEGTDNLTFSAGKLAATNTDGSSSMEVSANTTATSGQSYLRSVSDAGQGSIFMAGSAVLGTTLSSPTAGSSSFWATAPMNIRTQGAFAMRFGTNNVLAASIHATSQDWNFSNNQLQNINKIRIGSAGLAAHVIDIQGNSVNTIRMKSTAAHSQIIYGDANHTNANTDLISLAGWWNGKNVSAIKFKTGSDTINKDNGSIEFLTASTVGSLVLRGSVSSEGLWDFGDNNLTTTGTIDALDFNGVLLETGGTSTTYLSADGTYTTPAGGNASGGPSQIQTDNGNGTFFGTSWLAAGADIWQATTVASVDSNIGVISGRWGATGTSYVAAMQFKTGNDTINKDNGRIYLRTAAAGSLINALTIDENQRITFDQYGAITDLQTNASGDIIDGASDRTLKQDINKLDAGLDFVLAMRAVSYNWTEDSNRGDRNNWGFIAQDSIKNYGGNIPAFHKSTRGDYFSYESAQMIAPLYNAVKELNGGILFNSEKIDSQEEKIIKLERRVLELESIVNI